MVLSGKIWWGMSIGKNVKHFKPGNDVFGDLSGDREGFAEYVCARENAWAIKPGIMIFDEAAAIPQAAMLVIQGLRDQEQIQSESKIKLTLAFCWRNLALKLLAFKLIVPGILIFQGEALTD